MNDLTAILLCGGRGERLKPFSDTLPKPLVPLRDKPLLRYLLDYLYAEGVRRFVLCIGYKAEALRAFVAGLEARDWELICVDSGDATMTDRIADALPHVPGRALICYGDTLANVDLARLMAQHDAQKSLASITVYPLHSPFGLVYFDSDRVVTQMAEKPRLPYFINIGFIVCEPAALARMPRGTDLVTYLSAFVPGRELTAFMHEGRHLTVNTDKERKEAELQLVEFFTA
jgi:glucose-1-phosphate cytidylyltransferase